MLKTSPSLKLVDLDTANVVPAGCDTRTINQLIDFAYKGKLPFTADIILSMLSAAVALSFHEAIEIYERYMNDFFKHEHLEIPVATLGGILTLCQKGRRPFSKEALGELFDRTSKYLVGKPLGGLAANEGFLKALSPEAVAAFLDRDDLAKPDDEDKVCI